MLPEQRESTLRPLVGGGHKCYKAAAATATTAATATVSTSISAGTLPRWRHIAIKRLRYDSELHLAFLLGSISHPFYSRLKCDTAEMTATAGRSVCSHVWILLMI